ncbi:MAG: 6-phosphogluconolactonase [Anaerolineae bacterium]
MTDEFVVLPDPDAVAQEAARRWQAAAASAIERDGRFSVMLSGGSTPETLYKLLAQEPWRTDLPWEQTYLFWGDERRVPPGHPDSNFRMVQEALLDHVPVPPDQIFPLDGVCLARSSARDYERKLRDHFKLGRRDWPRFDLTLLGLGEDGHTASIFPGTRAVSDLSNMTVVYEVPQLGTQRMTVTLPVINNSRAILILAVGPRKADILATVRGADNMPSTYPIEAIDPADGTLTWLVDEDAAAKLP